MNTRKVTKQLEKKYPGKRIIKNDEKNPTEIICEIEPAIEHPEYSLVIAVLDKSTPHIHKKTTEICKVLKGKLTVYKKDEKFILNEGEEIVIKPGELHWAKGNETWVQRHSKPGWTPKNQILV